MQPWKRRCMEGKATAWLWRAVESVPQCSAHLHAGAIWSTLLMLLQYGTSLQVPTELSIWAGCVPSPSPSFFSSQKMEFLGRFLSPGNGMGLVPGKNTCQAAVGVHGQLFSCGKVTLGWVDDSTAALGQLGERFSSANQHARMEGSHTVIAACADLVSLVLKKICFFSAL